VPKNSPKQAMSEEDKLILADQDENQLDEDTPLTIEIVKDEKDGTYVCVIRLRTDEQDITHVLDAIAETGIISPMTIAIK